MSHKPVVYRLESQKVEGADWLPVLGAEHQPMTWTGRGSKSQAVTYAALLLRYPSFWSLRVMKSGASTPVKVWTKQEGVSA